MSFLNALFLIALPLVAVPVLLHFVRRREKKVVPWGAMRFLQEAATESRRMKLPESLLLMLLRCAMVAGLIFALARPLLTWGGGASDDRELIVIVDDSLSTARRQDDETVFASVQAAAQEVVEKSRSDSRFRLLLAAGGGRWIGEQAENADSRPGRSALKKLADAKPTAAKADLFSCIQMALADKKGSSADHVSSQRIVVITDGTNPGWQSAGEKQLARLRKSLDEQGLVPQIQILEVGVKPDNSYANLSIMRLEPLQERVGPEEKIRLAGQVSNTGNVASLPCEVTWQIGGRVRSKTTVPALDPGQSSEISFSTKIKKPGPVAIDAKLNPQFRGQSAKGRDDDLPLDSVATAIVEVVNEVPILIIDNTLTPTTGTSSESEADPLPQEVILLTSALGYSGDKPNRDYHSVFAPKLIVAEDAMNEDLSSYHAIFVRGADNQSAEVADRLLTELQRGCGVWITLDAETDVAAFNEHWHQNGAGICPLPLVDALTLTDESADQQNSLDGEASLAEDLRIHPPSTLHPATRTLGDLQRVDLDEVTIQKHATFEPLLLGDEVSVLLRSNRGQPLAIENGIGKGRVIIQSFPLSLDATTWPVTSSFVVLVHDWLDYLTRPSAMSMNLTSGNPIAYRFSDVASRPAWLTLPDGTEIDLTESASSYGIQGTNGTFRYFGNQLPGTYVLQTSAMVDNPRDIPFHVARSAKESKSEQLTDDQRTLLTDVGGIEWGDTIDQLTKSAAIYDSSAFTNSKAGRQAQAGGQGQPIWQTLITAMIAMILIELLLAGRIGSRRGGNTTSTTNQSRASVRPFKGTRTRKSVPSTSA